MQAGTLISAVIAPSKGQPGAQSSGAADAGSFTQVLMAVLGGPTAEGALSPTTGVAGAGQTAAQSPDQGSAATGNAAGENSGDGQDAGLGPIVDPAAVIAAAKNVVTGAPGLEVASIASANGQTKAQEYANQAAQTHANGVVLAGQAASGETGDAPATQGPANESLDALLAATGAGAKNGGAAGTTPNSATNGEVALIAGDSSAILVEGVDGPPTAGGEGPDRLGVAVEAPSTDKSSAVAAQTAIRISALNETPSKATDVSVSADQSAARGAIPQTASIGDSAADGSGDRPPTPQTAIPQVAPASSETETAFQLTSSANDSVTQNSAAASASAATSASANASDGTSMLGQPARPANPALVNAQVAVHITRATAEGLDKITIQLQPESLGRVDVKLEIANDGRMTATILADKADTLDMLQRDARGLERALQEAGLKTDSGSLSFHLRGNGGDGSEFAQQMNNSEAGNGEAGDGLAGDDIDGPEIATSSTYIGNGLLDIHV